MAEAAAAAVVILVASKSVFASGLLAVASVSVGCRLPTTLSSPLLSLSFFFFFLLSRPGDRIVATSATLGDVLWEKNTVDGILSAVGTRLVFSNTVTLRVERALDAQQLAAAR